MGRLTVKLRGRAQAQAALTSIGAIQSRRARRSKRRGRILSSSARGADMQACHGPLQRLLEVTVLGGTVRVRPSWRNPRRHSLPLSAPLRWEQSHFRAWHAAQTGAAAASRVRVGARPRPQSKPRPAARAHGCVNRRRSHEIRVYCRRHSAASKQSGPSSILR